MPRPASFGLTQFFWFEQESRRLAMCVADVGDFVSFVAADQLRTEPFFEFLKRFFQEPIEWKDLFFIIRLPVFGHNYDQIGTGFLGFKAKFV
jgi:hypothetical protein